MLPLANQARKAIWTAVDSHTGVKRIDWAFPEEIRESTRDQEMMIRFKNGSTWQVLGSDNYQGAIGSGVFGIVFSEYMLSDPNSFLYLDPILQENNGWAIFNGTPRGRNHFYKMVKYAMSAEGKAAGWYGQVLTVRDTGLVSAAEIEQRRRTLAAQRGDDDANNIIAQEYYCSWDAALPGAYYGRLMSEAQEQNRITRLPYDPTCPVTTSWDLGVSDATAIWFCQQVGYETRLIDYYENAGYGVDHYAKVLHDRGYLYAGHILPHDAQVRDFSNGTARVDVLKKLGIKPVKIMPQTSIADGINAARILIKKAIFDEIKCARGIECLQAYQRKWDDKLKAFGETPIHDWSSNGADSFRYLAQGLRAHGPAGGPGSRPDQATM